jgi:predicted PurR-regulated permease PerM
MLADLPTAPWFRRVLVAALILGIVLLTFSVLRPFVVPLIWGGILAYVSWPLQQRIVRALRGRNGLASLLTTLLVTLAIVVPLIWLILMVRVEAVAAYGKVQTFLASQPTLPQALRDLPWVGAWAQDLLQQLSADPTAIREQLLLTMEQSSVEADRRRGTERRETVLRGALDVLPAARRAAADARGAGGSRRHPRAARA